MIWIIILIMLPFGIVIFSGAPFVPSKKPQIKTALKLLPVKKGKVFLDLGCGSGTVLVEAAKAGWKVEGIELNPFLFVISWLRLRRFGDRAKVHFGDMWNFKIPANTEVVYIFLLERFMDKVDGKLEEEAKGKKLVSFSFELPNKKPLKSENNVHIYQY